MKLFFQGRLKVSFILILICFVLTACAGGPNATPDQQEAEASSEPPLEKAYSDIVVLNFDSTPGIKGDYPDAASESQASLISALLMKKAFESVTVQKADTVYGEGALLVKTYIADMRIVGFWARFWGGALSGASYMDMYVTLIDASTNKELCKKEIQSSNNAIAATWAFGANDRSLPSDMGEIIADYILSTVPHK